MEDIKTGQFNHVYLLCGEEDYLRGVYKDKLVKAMTVPDDNMNFTVFEGKNIEVGKVIDLAQTLPFLAPRRVILIENSGFFKSSQEQLAEYMKEIPEDTYFIFCEKEVDKRSKLYKAVKNEGYISEFGIQDEATLQKWILQLVAKEQKQISSQAMELFLSKTGTDMANIQSEFEKLACYTMDKDAIMPEDVEAICTERVQNRIFDMVEAVAGRRQKQALSLYYDLIALKEPPMRILFMIARHFNLLMQTKSYLLRRMDQRMIAEKMSLAPFIVRKYMNQASKFELSFLRRMVEECVDAEERVKKGKMTDIIAVEMLIIEASRSF